MSPLEVQITREVNGNGGISVWTCPTCSTQTERVEWRTTHLSVCPACGFHARISARERIGQLADPESFEEEWTLVRTLDPLGFVDLERYTDRVREAQAATGQTEALVAGRAAVDGIPIVLAVLDFSFMGGSMGSVVGEKLYRAAEAAIAGRLPLVAVCSSGGARMQEGILSLMQMAKTTIAVDMLNQHRIPYITVLADPCTGGVIASFASLADICVAEPGARLYFSGPRVIRETTREELPEGFSSAERNLALGHLDAVVPRAELRTRIASYLRLLEGGAANERTGPDDIWSAGAGLITAGVDKLEGAGRRATGGFRRRIAGARDMGPAAARRAKALVKTTRREPE